MKHDCNLPNMDDDECPDIGPTLDLVTDSETESDLYISECDFARDTGKKTPLSKLGSCANPFGVIVALVLTI